MARQVPRAASRLRARPRRVQQSSRPVRSSCPTWMREVVWLGCRGEKKKCSKQKTKRQNKKMWKQKSGSERNLKADLNPKTRQQHKANTTDSMPRWGGVERFREQCDATGGHAPGRRSSGNEGVGHPSRAETRHVQVSSKTIIRVQALQFFFHGVHHNVSACSTVADHSPQPANASSQPECSSHPMFLKHVL